MASFFHRILDFFVFLGYSFSMRILFLTRQPLENARENIRSALTETDSRSILYEMENCPSSTGSGGQEGQEEKRTESHEPRRARAPFTEVPSSVEDLSAILEFSDELDSIKKGLATIMNRDHVNEWLCTPGQHCEGLAPIQVVQRGSAHLIWMMINRLRAGNFY